MNLTTLAEQMQAQLRATALPQVETIQHSSLEPNCTIMLRYSQDYKQIQVAAVIENTPVDLVAPVLVPLAPTAADATAAGLSAIGATAAWQRGITGKGTLVASLDTGVDGTHPALAARYRGLQQAASASWLDPFAETQCGCSCQRCTTSWPSRHI